MKKLLIALTGLTLVFSSCSSSDESLAAEAKLPIKLEQISDNNTDVDVSNYIYDDNGFLTKATSGKDFEVKFIYDNQGNIIEAKQNFQETRELYEYTNGALSKYTRYENGQKVNMHEYFYENGKVSSIKETNPFSGTSETLKYEYLADNKVKQTMASTSSSTYTIITYDGKKTPFNDAPYVLKMGEFLTLGNKVSSVSYVNNELSHTFNRTITFDDDGYPLKMVDKDEGVGGHSWGETRIYTYNK